MNIDSEGRLFMYADDKPMTPEGATISGYLGHMLYNNPGLTLDKILVNLQKTRWAHRSQEQDLVREVLEDYIQENLVSLDPETGVYDMTNIGIGSFLSGWW